MLLEKLPLGENPPSRVNVVIEISGGAAGGSPVKYEVEKESGLLLVDRIVNTPMFYPYNYGFVPNTLHEDDDPVDVLVRADYPLMPGCVVPCRLLGVLKMEDDGGQDDKIIAAPGREVDPFQAHISDMKDIPQIELERIKYFFEHYKDMEEGKWVKITGWGDREEAEAIMQQSIERAQAAK